MYLIIASIIVFLINIPLGFWREGVRKFSLSWFIAIHAAVPAIVGMRSFFDLGHAWYTYAIFVPLYFLGQRSGALIRISQRKKIAEISVTSE